MYNRLQTLSLSALAWGRGMTRWGKEGRITWAPNHYGGSESLRGARNDCEGVKKAQQCHRYFLQNNTFAPERPQVRTWGHRTCFLPRVPSTLVTPLGPKVRDPFWWNRSNRLKTGSGWEALAYSSPLHHDLHTWSSCCVGLLPITRVPIVLFFAFVRHQQTSFWKL